MTGKAHTKGDEAYQRIKRQILEGVYLPGERLTIRQLQTACGYSGAPIREALRRLQQEGLVEIIPYSGARVRRLTPFEIEEAYLIRGHLEGLACQTAGPYLTEVHFSTLQQLIEEMDACDRANDGPAYGALNKKFHMTIYRAGPYQRLADLIASLWEQETLFQMVFSLVPSRRSTSQEEHRQLLALLSSGRYDEAGELTNRHKLATGETAVRHWKEWFPDAPRLSTS